MRQFTRIATGEELAGMYWILDYCLKAGCTDVGFVQIDGERAQVTFKPSWRLGKAVARAFLHAVAHAWRVKWQSNAGVR
jgi:hypothetical protein